MEVQENKRISWIELWIEFAKLISKRSTCKRRQIGVAIVTEDLKKLVNFGYNGNFAGGPNICDNPGISEGCGCSHSESNALIKPRAEGQDYVMFAQVVPCVNCAKLIINSGDIKKIYYTTDYHNTIGLDLLKNNGVEVIKYEEYPNKET